MDDERRTVFETKLCKKQEGSTIANELKAGEKEVEKQIDRRRRPAEGSLLKHKSLTKKAPKSTLWDAMGIALITAPGCSEIRYGKYSNKAPC